MMTAGYVPLSMAAVMQQQQQTQQQPQYYAALASTTSAAGSTSDMVAQAQQAAYLQAAATNMAFMNNNNTINGVAGVNGLTADHEFQYGAAVTSAAARMSSTSPSSSSNHYGGGGGPSPGPSSSTQPQLSAEQIEMDEKLCKDLICEKEKLLGILEEQNKEEDSQNKNNSSSNSQMSPSVLKHTLKLIESEISRLQSQSGSGRNSRADGHSSSGSNSFLLESGYRQSTVVLPNGTYTEPIKFVDVYRERPIRLTVRVLVPVREHPKFNFVGKLLGPKGNSMKRLQEETMTKMAVLGRGSMRDKQKEEELRASADPKYQHLHEELHVEITAFAPPAEAHARVAYALTEVRKYLIPDSNDEIRQIQMREMEILAANGGNPAALLQAAGGGDISVAAAMAAAAAITDPVKRAAAMAACMRFTTATTHQQATQVTQSSSPDQLQQATNSLYGNGILNASALASQVRLPTAQTATGLQAATAAASPYLAATGTPLMRLNGAATNGCGLTTTTNASGHHLQMQQKLYTTSNATAGLLDPSLSQAAVAAQSAALLTNASMTGAADAMSVKENGDYDYGGGKSVSSYADRSKQLRQQQSLPYLRNTATGAVSNS